MTDENGLVYMRARYYLPELRRFINADIVSGDISNAITLNRYAYANGNPVSFVDPLGLSADDRREKGFFEVLGDVFDGIISFSSIAAGTIEGNIVTIATCNPIVGFAAGTATTGAINNIVNTIYYDLLPTDIESGITSSTYSNNEAGGFRYVNRWESLAYTKEQVNKERPGSQLYDITAWKYNSEYRLHMYGWRLTRFWDDSDQSNEEYDENFILTKIAKSSKKADVDVGGDDSRFLVRLTTIILGALGL